MQRKLSKTEVTDQHSDTSKDSQEQSDSIRKKTHSRSNSNSSKSEKQTLIQKCSTRSRISQIQHTELFDISECSKSIIKPNNETQKGNPLLNQVSAVTNHTISQYIFWDESSQQDVKMLQISNGVHGQRKIEQIVIPTEKYAGTEVENASDDFFSSLI
ncbi:Hypothetical_protein [Hexamita inflata]|uniref:Hypothetical_protein n=1 Tax=Hexamita inflata TaxID=28002 RepID=A0AA86PIH3_9EUKA|nr:Hypothetical protein HINF_LOCUS23544 [Hexamita inflata]